MGLLSTMDVTWGSYHRRQEMLRLVVARAEAGVVQRPWSGVPGLSLEFQNDAEILQELQHWWARLLVSRLHGLELEGRPQDAYAETAAAHRGLRVILDAYADHPALLEARRGELPLSGAA